MVYITTVVTYTHIIYGYNLRLSTVYLFYNTFVHRCNNTIGIQKKYQNTTRRSIEIRATFNRFRINLYFFYIKVNYYIMIKLIFLKKNQVLQISILGKYIIVDFLYIAHNNVRCVE